MKYTEYISNNSMLGIIQRVCNYVDPRLMNHGRRVSYLTWKMLAQTGTYSLEELRDICFMAILHDIGAYKTDEISRMLEFETYNIREHSVYGYLFIRDFSPLKEKSNAVLMHHINWESLKSHDELSESIKEVAQVLHLADRIDISMKMKNRTWEETKRRIKMGSGTRFSPGAVALAEQLTLEGSMEEQLQSDAEYNRTISSVPLTQDQITGYLKMMIFSIDFRSRHTVTHTLATTSISYELACYLGLDEETCSKIICGALLHDVGKIGIPVEILEFPGRLSPQAMTVMRTHVSIGDQIFHGEIEESIRRIALRHHEKLDGSGYPEGLKAEELTVPERILAVADILSALSGARSYKTAYDKERIIPILTGMKQDGLLDSDITDTAIHRFDCIMERTKALCAPLYTLYNNIQSEYCQLMEAPTLDEMIHIAWENNRLQKPAATPDLIFPLDSR